MRLNICNINSFGMRGVMMLAFLGMGMGVWGQTTITQWDFETIAEADRNSPPPSTGSGTASIVGSMSTGTTTSNYNPAGFGNCNASSNNAGGGWGISNAASGANETSGAQFLVSTSGFEDIIVSFEHRLSNAATRTRRFQYTLNGTDWINLDVVEGTNYTIGCANQGGVDLGRIDASNPVGNNAGDRWTQVEINLSAIAGANNNPNFGFRIVAAHYSNTGAFRQANSVGTAATAGTWRFDNVTVSGTSLITPTTYYYSGTGDLENTANWGTNTDGTGTNPPNFTNASQTYEIRNTAAVTLTNNWTVSGGGSKVALGDGTNAISLTLNGELGGGIDVSNNATLILNNATIPSFGTLATGSTVHYAQNSTVNIVGGVDYHHLILSGSGEKLFPNSNITIHGNWTVDGTTVNTAASSFRTISLNGNLTLANNPTFGTGTNSENHFHRRFNIEMSSSSAQTISGTGTLRCGRLISTKSDGSLSISGVSINLFSRIILNYTGTAAFADGGIEMTIGDNVEVNGETSAYNLTGTIILTRTDGTTSPHNIRRDGANSNNPAVWEFNNLLLNSTALINFQPTNAPVAYTIKGNLTIQNNDANVDLGTNNTISVGGNFTNNGTDNNLVVYQGGALTVAGSMTNNGTIELRATAKDKYARLITNAASGTGTVSQEMRLIPGSVFKWYAMGAPTTGVAVNSIGSGQFTSTSVYSWSAVDGWAPANTGTFTRGQGLFVAAGENSPNGFFTIPADNSNITFSGVNPDNSSDVVVTGMGFSATPPTGVTFSTNPSVTTGWNLLANPYHSDFDLNGLDTDNGSPEKSLHIRTISGYEAYNPATNTPSSARYLSPGEGFFVRATATGQNFTFARSRRATSGGDGLLRPTMMIDKVEVEVRKDSNTADVAYINFMADATIDFDGMYDAHKLNNVDAHPTFYTELGNYMYAINSLPVLTGKFSLPAGFKTATAGSYTISIKNLQDLNPSIQVTLEDKLTNTKTLLNSNDYTFTHVAANASDRFILHLHYSAIGLDGEEALSKFNTWVHEGTVHIKGFEDLGNARIRVTGLSGKVVYATTAELAQEEVRLSLPSLRKSIYVLSIETAAQNKNIKFIH